MTTSIHTTAEVRIPLYDREWETWDDVVASFKRVVALLESEENGAEPFIEIEWEKAAQGDSEFIRLADQCTDNNFWLRYNRWLPRTPGG